MLRAAVLAFADEVDPDLAGWIGAEGRFPSSMVDRITPIPSADHVRGFRETTGSTDRAPIFAESFRQWVIEDDFSDGRPDWNEVGAQFVDDVSPYEKMKLRLLNASHLATAGLGALHGYETVREAIEDPLIRRYMEQLMKREASATLDPVPGIDLADYRRSLMERFVNPAINDTLGRINADAPLNLLLDPIRDLLASGSSIDLMSLGLAAWLERVARDAAPPSGGRTIGRSELLLQKKARAGAHPIDFLDSAEIFGSVGTDQRLRESVAGWLDALRHGDVEGTLRSGIDAGRL